MLEVKRKFANKRHNLNDVCAKKQEYLNKLIKDFQGLNEREFDKWLEGLKREHPEVFGADAKK